MEIEKLQARVYYLMGKLDEAKKYCADTQKELEDLKKKDNKKED